LGWASAAGASATSAVAQAPRRAAARLLHRTLTTLGVLLALLTAGAGTASAHTVGGTGSSNFHTVLGALSPATPGVSATVIEDGNRIQLTNTTATDLVVLGYDGEPFLRVGPAGTFHNKLSASYYYNIDRFGGTPVPTYADDKAAPVWVRDSMSDVARFHDHNTHYMSTDLPPLVRAAPGQPHLVSEWTVPMTYGGRSLAITGQLRWVPGPSPLPWYALALLTGLGAAALALTRRWGRLLAAATVAVIAADVVHSVGIAASSAGGLGVQLSTFVTGNAVEAVAWVVGLVGAYLLSRSRIAGFFVTGTAGAVLASVGGLGDVGVLRHSAAPFAWPLDLERALTAVTIGTGLGLVVAAVLGVRRHDAVTAPRAGARSPVAARA